MHSFIYSFWVNGEVNEFVVFKKQKYDTHGNWHKERKWLLRKLLAARAQNVFELVLIKHKEIPWLVASPDAVAIIQTSKDFTRIAAVEVKTHVSSDKILEAEKNAQDK